jgi:putative hydrolase of the HAD superfamily
VKAKRRVRCLMLDMGGVLTKEHRQDKLDELMSMIGANCTRDEFRNAYFGERSDYDRGTVDANEYWRRVTHSLGLEPPKAADIDGLIRVDLESWFNMRSGMLDFLGGVRGRVGRLVLLSNIHADGVRYIREGEGRSWASSFDELVLSCEHKLIKPEAAIYELALTKVGVSPDETLFIDDNQENVEAARRAGLESFRFTSEEDFFAQMHSDYLLSL